MSAGLLRHALLAQDLRLRWPGSQEGGHGIDVRQVRGFLPDGALRQRRRRGDGLLLARGDDAEEAPVAHHGPHARHRLDPLAVEGLEHRAIRGRAHDPTVQHARQLQVVHVDAGARHLVRQVEPRQRLADQRQLIGTFRRRAAIGVPGEIDLGTQLPIGRALVARLAVDGAVAHEQLVNAGVEPSRRGLQESIAYLGAGLPQRAAAVHGRPAAGGNALVRAAAGIGRDHADAGVVDVQLFRRDLRQGGGDALADFDLAGAHLDARRRS